MGIVNDMIFVRKNTQEFEGPFLEVGSKNYGNTQPIREFFPATALYRGVDIESGPGVDVVLDLGGKIDQIDNTLGTLRFGTIFCLNMLEHCENPFQVADNLMSLLKPGGKICISVPFACAFHGYPSDYWRFTHEGIKKLFPKLTFDANKMAVASSRENDFSAVDNDLGKILFSSRHYFQKGHYFQGISAKLLKFLSTIGIFPSLAGYKYLLPTTIIYMIGQRQK